MALQNSFNNVLVAGLKTQLGSDATGDLFYRDINGFFQRLPIGSAGQLLTVTSGLPSWVSGASPGGNAGGDLTGTFPSPSIAPAAVTYAKIQNVSATSRFLGRASAGAGSIEELTSTQVSTLLGLGTAALANTGTSNGNVPVLDVNGKLNSSVVPAVSLTTFFGTVADQSARLALTSTQVQPNDFVKQANNGISYVLTAADPSVDANWTPIGDATIVASDIVSGIISTDRLASGTANASTYFRGDQTWATIPSTLTPWNEITGTSQAMAVNNRYATNNAALVTLTLPTTAAIGEIVRVRGIGAGGWRIAQGAGQVIYFGNATTTSGATGRLDSSHRRDCIDLECVVANNEWQVVGSVGSSFNVV